MVEKRGPEQSDDDDEHWNGTNQTLKNTKGNKGKSRY